MNAANNLEIDIKSSTAGEHQFLYFISQSDFKYKKTLVLPRLGYLLLNFFNGDFRYKFINYNFPKNLPNHLYLTSLFSEEPGIFQQHGKGNGYVMKIHPVTCYHFLKVPMDQLLDQQILLSEFFEKSGRKLRQLETDRHNISFDGGYLNEFLKKNLPEKATLLNDPIYHAVNTIIEKKGLIKVKNLAAVSCMSERTLNRHFKRKVGLSPKSYAKILQIQFVAELLDANPDISFQDLAYRAGYFDPSHLAHDIQEKRLRTPVQFQGELSHLLHNYLHLSNSV